MTISPEPQDVIRASHEARLADVWTALPGRVESYDASKQKADIKPLVGSSHLDRTGARVADSLPVVPSVPVMFPGAGGFRLTFPVQVGDFGLLIFCSQSLDQWLVGSGGEVDPGDDRRHALSDGVFVPGLKPFGAPWNADPANLSLGNDSGDAVIAITSSEIHAGGTSALATKADIDALTNYVGAMFDTGSGHIHSITGAVTGPPVAPPGPPPSAAPLPTLPTAAGTDVLKGG